MVVGSEWGSGDFKCGGLVLCAVGSGYVVMAETNAKQAVSLTDFKIGYATLYGLNFNCGAGLRIAGDA